MVKHKLQKHNYELSTYRNTKRNYKFCSEFVGNKAKRRILKRVGVSRKQSTPNFAKNEHFLSTDTHTFLLLPFYQRIISADSLTDPSSEILIITNLRHTANRIWTCKKPEFRFSSIKLHSSDNHNSTVRNPMLC